MPRLQYALMFGPTIGDKVRPMKSLFVWWCLTPLDYSGNERCALKLDIYIKGWWKCYITGTLSLLIQETQFENSFS
jgi:hypothetical protein